MGVFSVRIRVFSLKDARKSREIVLTVDTGATYPVLPRRLAEELDARPEERRTFTLANGERIERDIGYVGMEYGGRRCPTLVVLGEPGDASLLGAIALEALGYEADPTSKTLRPTTQYLMGLSDSPGPAAVGT
jgi:predicted aspartyl protease